jgi:excinuclease ABC subunit B
MYSDRVTDSMQKALDEVNRRREVQRKYNLDHGITPTQVKRAILDLKQFLYDGDGSNTATDSAEELLTKEQISQLIKKTEKQMMALADDMAFEEAALARDKLVLLREMDIGVKPPVASLLTPATESQEGKGNRKSQPRKYRRKR